MISWSGKLSRFFNFMIGGAKGQTLCARVAAAFGPRCLLCRLINLALRQANHCGDELRKWNEENSK